MSLGGTGVPELDTFTEEAAPSPVGRMGPCRERQALQPCPFHTRTCHLPLVVANNPIVYMAWVVDVGAC
jgi:hypothetical protein